MAYIKRSETINACMDDKAISLSGFHLKNKKNHYLENIHDISMSISMLLIAVKL